MRRLLLLAFLASFALPAAAQRCDTALDDATERYRSGYFDEAIERLTDCLEQNAFSAEERRRVYRLLGLSYIGKDREQDAREAVRALLDVAPDYQPDPALDPPPFIALVREMNRSERRDGAAPSGVSARPSVSRTKGFMAAFRAQGTSYSEEGASLQGAGGELALGYGITPQLAFLLHLSGSSMEQDVSLGSVSLGGRYHIGGSRAKLVPYLGAAVAYQSLTVEVGGVSVEGTGPGGEIEGGIFYFFNPSWAASAGVTALFSSLGNQDLEIESSPATTVNYGVGVSWTPGQ